MKFILLSVCLFFASNVMAAEISTHILDLSSGKGGAGVSVQLEMKEKNEWKKISSAMTDANGRVKVFEGAKNAKKGLYRLTFELEKFYKTSPAFFPLVTINFQVTSDDEHYHVPLVLSPFGYSTYRGN